MKLSRLAPLGLALSSAPALAEEGEGTSFAPSLEVIAGIAPGTFPIDHQSSFAGDLHGVLGVTLEGEPLLGAGAGLGVSIKNWELKPLGIHAHCHGDEGCEASYSIGAYGTLNSDWSMGAGLGIGSEGITEIRLPIAFKGFALIPSLHHEEETLHPAIQATAWWQTSPSFKIGPHCEFSEELIHCGASLGLGHAHPH